MSSNWIIYFKERFPLVVYLPVVVGINLSGISVGLYNFRLPPLVAAIVGLLIFFFQLRLMDDSKDHEKDTIAHPDRPLPRGLLLSDEVHSVIMKTMWVMFAYGLFLTMAFSALAGLAYLILTAYLWLMYREFYMGKWLNRHQILYAFSHQIVLVPVCMFPVLLSKPAFAIFPNAFCFSILLLGAFFTYEISRKLDPDAHPILQTYRSLYGTGGCFFLILVGAFISGYAAWCLGVNHLTWPFLILLLISYATLTQRKPRLVKTVASVSLLFHIWVLGLLHIGG